MLSDRDKVTFFFPVSHITAVVSPHLGWKAVGSWDRARQARGDTGLSLAILGMPGVASTPLRCVGKEHRSGPGALFSAHQSSLLLCTPCCHGR